MITKEGCMAELKQMIISSEKNYDLDAISRAIDYACEMHAGQLRSSGEEYVCHPLQVAMIMVELGMDSETVEAALLHDVVEDTPATPEDIKRQFGESVAALVDGVTKLDRIPYSTREEQQAESIRKMLLAISKDVRVIIIKLGDRLHNMRTIDAVPEEKRLIKAKETMDVYAPLAHRLGIRSIKEELEDRSLRVLDPIAYQEIEDAIALQKDERQAFLDSIQQRIAEHLKEYGLNPYITGRMKSIAGIYRKMYVQGRSLDEIYDVYAVRVIVDSVNDCYNVLGIIHEMFRPLPGRFKDYISTPKANMYQSLHTTVIGKDKVPFEVQIRTWEMHYTAEYGIAAHWKYKLGIRRKDKLEERLAWVRQFIENQKEVDDAEEIVHTIKTDLSSDDIFVFTPKGDVITLPEGSTIIDFAYAIHSAVGHRMTGAKVDGRISPLDTVLKTGQIVEILTTSAENHGPSRDWLQMAKTGEARTKIRAWFKKERREENVTEGREMFERELSRNQIRLPEDRLQELVMAQARRQNCATMEDFYAAVGYGGILLSRIIPRLKDEATRIQREEEALHPENVITAAPKKHNHGGVIIEGMDNCLVKFARCCNPLPGDDIIGFITRGNGVSVHKRDCVNVPRDLTKASEPERWVSVSWEDSVSSEFKTTLYIEAHDRPQLLADLLSQLSAMRVAIHAVTARDTKDSDIDNVELTISVSSVGHLEGVIARLQKVGGVLSIRR